MLAILVKSIFEFLFGYYSGKVIPRYTNNLSKALQIFHFSTTAGGDLPIFVVRWSETRRTGWTVPNILGRALTEIQPRKHKILDIKIFYIIEHSLQQQPQNDVMHYKHRRL